MDDTSVDILDVHSSEELMATSQLQTISSSSTIIVDIPMAELASDPRQGIEPVVIEGSSLRETEVCISPQTISVLEVYICRSSFFVMSMF